MQRIIERTKVVSNTYQIGEVCQILVKDNPELRGKGGCWGIVSAVNEFSCTVRVWDGEYAVGLKEKTLLRYYQQAGRELGEIERVNALEIQHITFEYEKCIMDVCLEGVSTAEL